MKKTKILITVSGGLVQSVCSNTDIDIAIVDYDNLETGIADHGDTVEDLVNINEPDMITDNLYECIDISGRPSQIEKEVHELLKDKNF